MNKKQRREGDTPPPWKNSASPGFNKITKEGGNINFILRSASIYFQVNGSSHSTHQDKK